MKSRRLGPRLFALPVLAMLGLMAICAVGARAQTHTEKLHAHLLSLHAHQLALEKKELPLSSIDGFFLILNPGKSFEEEGLAEATFTGEQLGAGRFVIPGRLMTIGCETADLLEGKVTSEVAHAKITFLGCTVWNLKKEAGVHQYALGTASPCHITGLAITAFFKIKAVLHEDVTYVLAEPLTENQPFTAFTYLSGTGCPLPLSTQISGSFVASINQTNVVAQELSFGPAIQLLLGDKTLYGTFEMYLETNWRMTLTGAFAGAAWGAH